MHAFRQANTFVAHLPNMMRKLSILHAVYGIGALVCPLVATQFAQIPRWHFHYLCSLGLAVMVCPAPHSL
jgi:fucose permease